LSEIIQICWHKYWPHNCSKCWLLLLNWTLYKSGLSPQVNMSAPNSVTKLLINMDIMLLPLYI